MPRHSSNLSANNNADQLGRIIVSLFREHGWQVIEESRNDKVAPDFLALGHGKKLVIEVKRASEGRKDRVIPLLSQAALEAAHYARSLPDHPIPVAIVGKTAGIVC